MSIFYVSEKRKTKFGLCKLHAQLFMYESGAVFKQADHLSIEQYMTRCTLFCDYCEILRNKHVGLFKIGLNWT